METEQGQSPVDEAAGDTQPLVEESPSDSTATEETLAVNGVGEHVKSLEAIRRKLSLAGLTDEGSQAAEDSTTKTTTTPKLTQHRRRSRSVGQLEFQGPIGVAKTEKRSYGNLGTKPKEITTVHVGLEEIKKTLLSEIKTRLQKQIESKLQNECHKDDQFDGNEGKSGEDPEEKTVEDPQEKLQEDEHKSKVPESPTSPEVSNPVNDNNPPATPDDGVPKRFSICSLNGVELRKRYSPVYERTRKIVRQSSSSINRCSTSQSQVDKDKKQGPSSPTISVETEGTATVLSPVTSKGDLEAVDKGDSDGQVKTGNNINHDIGSGTAMTTTTTTTNNGFKSVPLVERGASPMTSSTSTRLGQYSAHPSVYVIEQEDRKATATGVGGSSGIDTSQSDRMDRSTSTLKRGASFRGLKKNLKKTFSTQLPAITLEKADKAPDTNVPAIVVCCVETLRRKGFLKTEGLYRSSPSQLEVRKVIKHARKGQYEYIKSVEDPVILAGTLKSFFFNLKHHIITDEVMQKNFPKKCLMGSPTEQEYIERLKGVISDLDTIHYESLEYIIKHLQEVASYSKFNLMTPSNLGVVWAPCLFTNCDKSMDGADLLSFMGEQTRLLELLITHADLLFDRYTLDEIMIAIEDGYHPEDGEPALNLRPDFDSMLGDGNRVGGPGDFERRKLMRNLSLTFDNVYEASGGAENGHAVRRNYDLQNSSTVPVISYAQSDGTVPRIQKMRRSKSRAVCVVS